MFGDLLSAFTGLFTQRRSRVEVSALLLLMAALPVSELLVTRLFSHLVLGGPERLESDPRGLVLAGAGFFAAFAVSRALHHVVRLNRVRVFRRGFESSEAERPRHQEAWSWAAAFELSTASVALIQVLAFGLLFVWIDPVSGALNGVVAAAVLALVAVLYRRQLERQLAYLVEDRAQATGVGERVGRRLRDAELGAVLASLGMALALAWVLLRAVTGALTGADAIVLFIGLRMMYSQVGHLSASAMRFARVRARLATAGRGGAEPDGDDDGDGDGGDLANAGEDGDGDAAEARAAADLPPAAPTAHRAQLARQMLLAGQNGDLDGVGTYAARLRVTARPGPQELRAQECAEAFARLAAPSERPGSVPLAWWSRPFPGTVGHWVVPLLVRRHSGRPVVYRKPGVGTERPYLVAAGSLLGSVGPSSVVVGAGVAGPDDRPDPRARYLAVRGPLSAEALRRAGGPTVTTYGDPTLLAPRLLPLTPAPANGRLALVRHVSQQDLPVRLPDEADELTVLASRPDDVERVLTALASYDGVVTSDPGVTALCHAYGMPCAAVALEPRPDLDLVLRDQALGSGLDVPAPHPVGTDLRHVALRDLLATRTVAADVVDAVQDRLEQAVALCLEQDATV